MKRYVTVQKKKFENNTNLQTDKREEVNTDNKIVNNSETQIDGKTEFNTSPKLDVGRKLTFKPTSEKSVMQKIQDFRKLSEVNQCVIGSGYCSGHNVKLERTMKKKRVSKIGTDGKIEWIMREVTSLVCPAKMPRTPAFNAGAMMSQQLGSEGTNGKRRKLEEDNNDQSQPDSTRLRERETRLLDEKITT